MRLSGCRSSVFTMPHGQAKDQKSNRYCEHAAHSRVSQPSRDSARHPAESIEECPRRASYQQQHEDARSSWTRLAAIDARGHRLASYPTPQPYNDGSNAQDGAAVLKQFEDRHLTENPQVNRRS
jgi:hypothetical protein